MKTPDTKNFDQNEAATLQAQLGLHAANLRGLLADGDAKKFCGPSLVAGDCLGNIDLLVSHITELEQRSGSSCPQFSAGVVQHGGTQARPAGSPYSFKSGVFPGASAKSFSNEPLTLTEKVLQARGAKSLAELNSLRPPAGTLD